MRRAAGRQGAGRGWLRGPGRAGPRVRRGEGGVSSSVTQSRTFISREILVKSSDDKRGLIYCPRGQGGAGWAGQSWCSSIELGVGRERVPLFASTSRRERGGGAARLARLIGTSVRAEGWPPLRVDVLALSSMGPTYASAGMGVGRGWLAMPASERGARYSVLWVCLLGGGPRLALS